MTDKADILVQDGPYENVFLGAGGKNDRSAYTRTTPGMQFDQIQLENIYQSDGFARRIIDLPAEEMVRAGFEIEGIDNGKDVLSGLEDIQALEKLCDALRWSDLFGGALLVLIVNDGGLLEEELNLDNIKAIEQIRVYDRYQVSHESKYQDPNLKNFGQTAIYRISPSFGLPYSVHESRCIALDGCPVPERTRQENDGWGASKLNQCYEQLKRFGMSQMWANSLLERAQQAVHGIPNLTGILKQAGGEALVRKRIDMVDMTRSVNNTIVIDAEESYDLKSTALNGVSDIMDRLGLALSAVSGTPESLLFGRQQAGLNSTGKSDLENWYAKIAQMQNTKLLQPIDRLVTLQLYALGTYRKDYLIKFNPLSVASAKEQSETDYRVAQTLEILYNIQALGSKEIRSHISESGMYNVDNVINLPETGEFEE